MTEQERIESIKANGGRHLQNFKAENVTYDMCLAAVEDDGYALEFVPEPFRDKKIYKAACKSHGTLLRAVPEKFVDKTICELSVCSEGTALQYVPEELRTEDMCFKAVCSESLAFQFTPPAILTPEFCAKVVKKKDISWIRSIPPAYKNTDFYIAILKIVPEVFWNIPKKNRIATVCKTAIKEMGYKTTAEAVNSVPKIFEYLHTSLYDHESCLEFIKSKYLLSILDSYEGHPMKASFIYDDMMTIDENNIDLKKLLRFDDVCELAIQIYPGFLEYVPNDHVTKELCELSVKTGGYSFEFVPDELRTIEMCALAFEQDVHNLRYIPNELKTEEMCLEAVKQDGELLGYVPESMITYEMCKFAIMDENLGFYYIPEELFDKELALLIIENEKHPWEVLNKIPKQLRDHDVCLAAVKKEGYSLEFVPKEVVDYEICLEAAKNSQRAALYIPKEFFTPEICLEVSKNGDYCFDKLPKKYLTTEICMEAIKHGSQFGTILGDVPRNLITQEMCDLAIKTSVQAFIAIPEKFVTEDILILVAERDPSLLRYNFPKKFRKDALFKKMIEANPWAERYINEYLRDK